MLKVRNLEAGYGSLRVLKGVSLHVREGEIVALIGANGAGKSTLLKTVSGLLPVRNGEVEVAGASIVNARPEAIVMAGCVHVPEGRQVFAPLTVEENLLLGAYTRLTRGLHDEAAKTLKEVHRLFPVLKARAGQYAGTLSGGEQQMLAIGRALMAAPRLLMLDEPSMGVAPLLVKEIFAAVRRLRDAGKTILIVEQNAKASLNIADRGYVIETGTLVLDGDGRDLLDNPDVQRAYLGKEYKRIND
ncbi:MAG: ABC transporter ATP-binding protein [Fibrobacterota bacterium]